MRLFRDWAAYGGGESGSFGDRLDVRPEPASDLLPFRRVLHPCHIGGMEGWHGEDRLSSRDVAFRDLKPRSAYFCNTFHPEDKLQRFCPQQEHQVGLEDVQLLDQPHLHAGSDHGIVVGEDVVLGPARDDVRDQGVLPAELEGVENVSKNPPGFSDKGFSLDDFFSTRPLTNDHHLRMKGLTAA